ncbi:hypothetical protein [Streptomyces koyangensis]|uniref:hypothetical protein n=1 Tax=Streptomyces koyangensis TaxID=188770 RepID=UPI003C2E6515
MSDELRELPLRERKKLCTRQVPAGTALRPVHRARLQGDHAGPRGRGELTGPLLGALRAAPRTMLDAMSLG